MNIDRNASRRHCHVVVALAVMATITSLSPVGADETLYQVYYAQEDGSLVTSNGPQFRVSMGEELAGAVFDGSRWIVGAAAAQPAEDAAESQRVQFESDGASIASNSPMFDAGAAVDVCRNYQTTRPKG